MVPTKVSVAQIRRFQEYSIEDRPFFARQSYDEEDQDPDVTLVGERRGEEGREDEERKIKGNFCIYLI